MKDFRKFIKELSKNSNFSVDRSSKRNNTVKITHIKSKELYSVHPSDYVVPTIKRWVNKKIKL